LYSSLRLKRKVEPLETEARQIKKRLEEIEREIGRYIKALGQGKLSIRRLESQIGALEADKKALQSELDEIEQQINESAIRDYSAELLQRTLQDFRTAFTTLNPAEQSEALQCVLKGVTVHPHKLALEIFELEEFHPGSQKRKDWLRGLDSNQDSQIQSLESYQLDDPGADASSVADARTCAQTRGTPHGDSRVARLSAKLLKYKPGRGVRAV
jgi:chromosome segregation ATPase